MGAPIHSGIICNMVYRKRAYMRTNTIIIVVLILLSGLLMFQLGGHYNCRVELEVYHPIPLYLRHTESDLETDQHKIILQNTLKDARNALSKHLNELKRKVGQLDCETTETKTSAAGGWCKATSREDSGDHKTDMDLVKALSSFFKGKRVGSFGDGPGAYKRELLKLGDVSQYDAYDGAPYCEETSEGRVKFLDLTVPAFGLPVYDWVLSLEVAEHIPREFENVYLDNLSRHCKEGIVISWAHPTQTGLGHLNGRLFDHLRPVMERYGFDHDNTSSNMLQDAASFSWFKGHLHVFVRKNHTYVSMLETWYT